MPCLYQIHAFVQYPHVEKTNRCERTRSSHRKGFAQAVAATFNVLHPRIICFGLFSPNQERHTQRQGVGALERARPEFSIDASVGVCTPPIVKKPSFENCSRGVLSYRTGGTVCGLLKGSGFRTKHCVGGCRSHGADPTSSPGQKALLRYRQRV